MDFNTENMDVESQDILDQFMGTSLKGLVISKQIELSPSQEAREAGHTAKLTLNIDFKETDGKGALEKTASSLAINWQNSNRPNFAKKWDDEEFVEKLDGAEFTYVYGGAVRVKDVDLEGAVEQSDSLEELERIEAAAARRRQELLEQLNK